MGVEGPTRHRGLQLYVGGLVLLAAAVAVWAAIAERPDVRMMALIGIGFAASELSVVHLNLGRSAFTFTFHETVLVVAMSQAGPATLVVGLSIGAVLVMVGVQRLPFIKVCFNVAQYVVWAMAIHAALSAFGGAPALHWPLTLALTSVAGLITLGLIAVAIFLADGASIRATVRAAAPQSIAMSATSASLGLLAIGRSGSVNWRSLVLLAPIVVAVYFGGRSYQRVRSDASQLELLRQAVTGFASAPDPEVGFGDVAIRCRRAFGADAVELVLGSPSDLLHRRLRISAERPAEWSDPARSESDHLFALARAGGGSALLESGLRTADNQPHHLQGSTAIAELSHAGVCSGVICLTRTGGPESFVPTDLRQLANLATHIATMLHCGRLTSAYSSAAAERDRLARQVDIDDVTGLPNRSGLIGVMDRDANRASGAIVILGVLNRDLIAELFGLDARDELMQSMARRIQGLIRDQDTVARIADHLFAVYLPTAEYAFELPGFVDRLQRNMQGTYRLTSSPEPVAVDSCAGWAGRSDEIDAESTLRAAEASMHIRRIRRLMLPGA